MDVGPWQPFADVEWNHELGGRNWSITTALTSIAAPSYTAAAAPVVADWATMSLGTSYALNSRATLRAAVSAEVFTPQLVAYGGVLSVSLAF